MTDETLPKQSRVLKRADFLRAQRDAFRVHDADFVMLLHRREPADGIGPRLGLVATRKIGGAVARNRGKRLVREWFRRLRAGLGADIDVVVILKASAARRGALLWPKLDAALAKALAKRPRSRKTGGVPSGNGPHRE